MPSYLFSSYMQFFIQIPETITVVKIAWHIHVQNKDITASFKHPRYFTVFDNFSWSWKSLLLLTLCKTAHRGKHYFLLKKVYDRCVDVPLLKPF